MRAIVIGMTVLCFLASLSKAMDIGNAVQPISTNKKWGLEIFYENYERKVIQDEGFDSGTFAGDQEENRIIGRIKFTGVEALTIHIDAGATESKGSDGYVPMFGMGILKDIVQYHNWTLSLFGKMNYVTEISYHHTYTKTDTSPWLRLIETYKCERKEEYWEYGGGFQLSKQWHLPLKTVINTYGGVQASFLNANGKETLEYEEMIKGRYTGNLYYYESGRSDDTNVDFRQKTPVGVFVGIVIGPFGYPFLIRAEARLIDQQSFSVGACYAF